MEKENNNDLKSKRSLFLYTALIFLVALIMIALSFFGQSNLEGIRTAEQNAKNLTEKAAVISNENLILSEQVKDLTKQLEEINIQVHETKTELEKSILASDALENTVSAYNKMLEKNKEEAGRIISLVNSDLLSEQGKILYNNVIKYISK